MVAERINDPVGEPPEVSAKLTLLEQRSSAGYGVRSHVRYFGRGLHRFVSQPDIVRQLHGI
jgi:hypothetical protein